MFHQVATLSEVQIGVRLVTGIDVKHILSGSPDPFGRHGNKLEDEGPFLACLLESEIGQGDSKEHELIEIVYYVVMVRKAAFWAMNDFGRWLHPKPLFISSNMRSLPPRRL